MNSVTIVEILIALALIVMFAIAMYVQGYRGENVNLISITWFVLKWEIGLPITLLCIYIKNRISTIRDKIDRKNKIKEFRDWEQQCSATLDDILVKLETNPNQEEVNILRQKMQDLLKEIRKYVKQREEHYDINAPALYELEYMLRKFDKRCGLEYYVNEKQETKEQFYENLNQDNLFNVFIDYEPKLIQTFFEQPTEFSKINKDNINEMFPTNTSAVQNTIKLFENLEAKLEPNILTIKTFIINLDSDSEYAGDIYAIRNKVFVTLNIEYLSFINYLYHVDYGFGAVINNLSRTAEFREQKRTIARKEIRAMTRHLISNDPVVAALVINGKVNSSKNDNYCQMLVDTICSKIPFYDIKDVELVDIDACLRSLLRNEYAVR